MSFLRRRTTSAILIVLGLLAVAPVATAVLVFKQRGDESWIDHTYEVKAELSHISALLQDAEAAQRGFMITDRARFFDEYRKASEAVSGEIVKLTAMVADNARQAAATEDLRALASTRLSFLGEAVDLQSSGRKDEAVALIKTGRGKALMDQGTDALRAMDAEEGRLLEARHAAAGRTSLWLAVAVAASILSAMALAFVILRQNRARLVEAVAGNAALREEMARREALEAQLRQAQKMDALGQLTGGIAHDFNNMLAIVIGSLDMARRRLARGVGDVSRQIEAASEGAQRAAVLTQRLLAFSRQQPLAPTVTDLNALIGGMSELLRRSIGEPVRVETVQGGGLWRICADAGQLEQALVNLAVNARDAMDGKGRLTIETFNASLDDAYAEGNHGVPAGQYVVIAVSDDGGGMSLDVAAKAFEPFFTTKTVGKGTGLGLSQVFGFVKQSGGHVKIYSEVDQGTTVKIYLPRYTGEERPQQSSRPDARPDIPSGRPDELLLVVEDDDRVRRMAVDALRELGYTVLHASGGQEALQMIGRHDGIRLLFTDVVMPDMNGRELADAVVARYPDMKVLYMTGYTRNAVIHDGKLDAGVALLTKPFTIAQLGSKVRRTLDRAAA